MSESAELTPFSTVQIVEDAPAEIISATAAYEGSPELAELSDLGPYIPGEIVRGEYGVTGFLVVDPQPERRWTNYHDDPEFNHNSWPADVAEMEEHDEKYGGWFSSKFEAMGVDLSNPKHKAWFIGTEHSAKMIRVFFVPEHVQEQLSQVGRVIGPAMVQECFTRDEVVGTIPHEEGMTDYPGRSDILFKDDLEDNDSFAAKLIRLTNGVASLVGGEQWPIAHHYLSYHGWPWLNEATAEGQRSIYRAIAEFDNVVAAFDRRRVMSGRGLGQLAVNNDTPAIERP